MSLIDLSGSKSLVTGASRGVGGATAEMLADAGSAVTITYRSRKGDAVELAESIKAKGGVCHVVQMEASDPESTDAAVREAASKMSGLDFFVANAGVWPPADVRVDQMDDSRWRATMAVNLDGVFFGCRAAARVIDEGAIVIVGSTAGQRGEALHSDYAATKGAVQAFTKSLAVELAPRIRVNCIAPGWIDTEMSAGSYVDGGRASIENSIPLRRVASAPGRRRADCFSLLRACKARHRRGAEYQRR